MEDNIFKLEKQIIKIFIYYISSETNKKVDDIVYK